MRKKGRISAFALLLIVGLVCAIILIAAAAVATQQTYNREKAVTPTPSITPRTVRITEAPGQPTLSPTPRLLQVNSVGMEVKELQEERRSEAEIASKIGLSPWIVKKNYLPVTRSLDSRRLARALQLCLQADQDYKSGRIDAGVAAEMTIIRLCG